MARDTFETPRSFDELTAVATENVWLLVSLTLATILIFTKTTTRLASTYRTANTQLHTNPIPRRSYWVPYIGSILSWPFTRQKSLYDHSPAPFALTLAGHDHIIISSPRLLAEIEPSTNTNLHATLRRRRFFGDSRATIKSHARITAAVHACATDRTRLGKLTGLLESQAYNLISPATSWVDQTQWERHAECTVTNTSPLSVTANITVLLRDFTTYIVTSTVLGTSFVEANASFVEDFHRYCEKYALFMTGIPYWIAPGLGPYALARERCLMCLDGLVAAIIAEMDGNSMSEKGIGMLYDLDDVHGAVWECVKQARDQGLTVRSTACEVLEVLWQIVFYEVNMVTWVMVYLFQGESAVLEAVRKEMKSIVQVVKPVPTGLAYEDPPRLKFNVRDVRMCPTLRASLMEIHRLEMEFEGHLEVQQGCVVEQEGGGKYEIKKGDYIYAAYGATNKDARRWERPRRFVPGRFVSGDGERKEVTSGVMVPVDVCFASLESEVACIVASILAFFEFGSADGKGLIHPGTQLIAGIGRPKKDVKGMVTRVAL